MGIDVGIWYTWGIGMGIWCGDVVWGVVIGNWCGVLIVWGLVWGLVWGCGMGIGMRIGMGIWYGDVVWGWFHLGFEENKTWGYLGLNNICNN